jgi:hypothetical protein
MAAQAIREPAVAGQFYPADPDQLRSLVSEFIEEGEVDAAPDRVQALIAPHAGFIFSGPAAGRAYARARGKEPERIVLLGGSHRQLIRTAQVFSGEAFESPLGRFPIDAEFAADLAQRWKSRSDEAHAFEHSLEVHLPFVEAVFGLVPIVPVLFGSGPSEWHANAGRQLAQRLGPNDLVIASTDFSHYLSQEQAEAIDKRSIQAVLQGDWKAYADGIEEGRFSMCGAPAIVVAMTCADDRGASERVLLDYRTSAKASGDYSRVVGYAAISLERPE